jgi:hypothetical protein
VVYLSDRKDIGSKVYQQQGMMRRRITSTSLRNMIYCFILFHRIAFQVFVFWKLKHQSCPAFPS